ncbi:MAG: NAD(P)/FAD-dependent oxidoreductase [Candidatus Liptonbacteria bacterium]|nr:NAD(P)/FAD-dependent oxidoreductase [Candidatus Liptonbacteria bacterium]
MTRILILGGGFGGTYLLRSLRRKIAPSQITLVTRDDYFTFTPLLHEVATGGLAPATITEPLRDLNEDNRVGLARAEIRRIRLQDRVVETDQGEISYDCLAVALGSESEDHGTPGVAEHALILKSLSDAVRIKNHVLNQVQAAARATNPVEQQRLARVVVVGGGATGIELAAELADLYRHTLRGLYPELFRDTRFGPELVLLAKADELLSYLPPYFRTRSHTALTRMGVVVRLGVTVTAVGTQGVRLMGGEEIASGTVLWAAGVRPSRVEFQPAVPRSARGRVIVSPNLNLAEFPEVFVLGDMGTPAGLPVPELAQAATKEAEVVAGNILRHLARRPLRPFRYRSSGSLLSLGRWQAIAQIGPVHLRGPFAWWLWRTIYLSKLLTGRKRLAVALEWTVNLFRPRDTRIVNDNH